jgi:hypothetical protein
MLIDLPSNMAEDDHVTVNSSRLLINVTSVFFNPWLFFHVIRFITDMRKITSVLWLGMKPDLPITLVFDRSHVLTFYLSSVTNLSLSWLLMRASVHCVLIC